MVKKTVFFPAKTKKYGKIVSLKNQKQAKASVTKLNREFRTAKTQAKKRRIKKVTVLAGTRARIMSQNKRLKPATRTEKRKVKAIYQKAHKKMKI